MDTKQSKRYKEMVKLYKREEIDCCYKTAFYIYSSDEELFDVAKRYINENGIRTDAIVKELQNKWQQPEELIILAKVARSLFAYVTNIKGLTPYDIAYIGRKNIEVIYEALMIFNGYHKIININDEIKIID